VSLTAPLSRKSWIGIISLRLVPGSFGYAIGDGLSVGRQSVRLMLFDRRVNEREVAILTYTFYAQLHVDRRCSA